MPRKEKPFTSKASPKRWSKEVTGHSRALDLEAGVFTLEDPKKIAASLKCSAEASRRRKGDPFRSAMSMLVFYINRAGKNLNAADPALRIASQQIARGDTEQQCVGHVPGSSAHGDAYRGFLGHFFSSSNVAFVR